MDRQRALAHFLIGAALPLLLSATRDAPALPIAEARWLSREAVMDGLTRQPTECVKLPSGKAERQSAMMGRVAFRAPLLLGGQAARAGLSCASCHRSGRGNPHFSFPGLSGVPGTADITSSLMSSHRGDGTVNPKPIPDLASPNQLISRDQGSRALETFIRGLIVEEFDGPEPSAAVLKGVADYVRAITPAGCPRSSSEPLSLTTMLTEVDSAAGAALRAAEKGDEASMRLLVGAARSSLGRIDERFTIPGLEASRAVLSTADAELRPIRLMKPAEAAPAIRAWRRRWTPRLDQLNAREARSFFSERVIRRHLQR